MLPRTIDTYDKIVGILEGFPELTEIDFVTMDLDDEETVRDLIKYLYMTLNGTCTALKQLRIAAELESQQYFFQHKNVSKTN